MAAGMDYKEEERDDITQPSNNKDEDTVVVKEAEEKKAKFSVSGALKALAQAVSNGNINAAQAKQFRRDLGIFQGTFTGSKINPSKRKRKNQLAKKARKVTRKNGYKGQKMTKGKR